MLILIAASECSTPASIATPCSEYTYGRYFKFDPRPLTVFKVPCWHLEATYSSIEI